MRHFLMILLLLFSIKGMAQNTVFEPSLVVVLDSLENRYQVSFTYLDDNVQGISLPLPSKKITLTEALQYVEKESGLELKQLDSRFITISKAETQSLLEVCGYIKDANNLKAISQATISAGEQFAVSDESGYFEFHNLPQNAYVTIRFLGYKPVKKRATAFLDCPEIRMKEEATTLKQVLVQDYLSQGIVRKADGVIEVQTAAVSLLPGLTEPDVLHTIQTLPGIQSANESVADLNIRGGNHDQNLILWDGIRMYQSGHFFGLITAFNPHITQKTSLIKNGTTVEYGQGVSGTIAIQTDNEVSSTYSGGAGMSLLQGDFYAKIPLRNHMSVQLSGRRSLADLVETPTYKRYFERAFNHTDVALNDTEKAFHFYDLSTKFLWDISPADKLRVSFLTFENAIQNEEQEQNQAKTSMLDQHSMAVGVHYDRLWNDRLKTTGQLYLSSYGLNAVNYDIPNDQKLIQENKVLETAFKFKTRWRMNDHLDFLSGYEFRETGITNLEDINNPAFRRLVKTVMRTQALFTEGNLITNRTSFRAGLRANYYSKLNLLNLEPRFSLHHQLLENLAFELQGEMKSQASMQVIDLQTDFLGVEKRRWVLSDTAAIPLVRSKQLSAGIQYEREQMLFSVEAYYKKVDGITASSQAFQNQFQFEQAIGSYKVRGIDFLLNKKWTAISAWLSYTLAENTYFFETFDPAVFPNNLDITHAISIGSVYQSERFELSAGMNWHSGVPYTQPLEDHAVQLNNILYQSPNSVRLPYYLRLDVSAKYKFRLTEKVRGHVAGSLWNVAARDNLYNIFYRLDQDKQVEEVKQYGLRITPNITFRLEF